MAALCLLLRPATSYITPKTAFEADASIRYYTKILKIKNLNELNESQMQQMEVNAKSIYLARKAISREKHQQAEKIYVNLIDRQLERGYEALDVPAFAATALLLALHQQRQGAKKRARATFNLFFRIASDFYADESEFVHSNPSAEEEFVSGEVCSARVLQAFALFESKEHLMHKSEFLIKKAIEFDPSIKSLLKWKVFSEFDDHNGDDS
ncbi:hypothetical protein TrST_g10509 [Triparma strigata]|uniref:Uncharacterized protein n=1 Tax=Triparma strigata TaxID=1606541 RepID=A0A9W6ZL77_9STRA|nr:hypothetical protein TrST_g10509 [Triparma strigata]